MNRIVRLTALLLTVAALAACGEASVPATEEPLPADAIALDYYRGHYYFDAAVCDSLPARLVFDTGATGLCVDSTWLARSGWKPRRLGQARLSGAGSATESVPLLLDTLAFRVDTLRLESRHTAVVDLKSILGRRADGIFGPDYFAGRCVLFDLGRGYMRGIDADTLAAAGFSRAETQRRGNDLFVRVRVRFDAARVVEGWFLLDTGCGSELVVNAPAARRAGLDGYEGRRLCYATVAGGIGGASEIEICRADSVAFGGRTLAGVPVGISRNASGYLSREDVAGVIGNKLLERFLFAIDFAASVLWLRPAEGCYAPFAYEAAGIGTIDRTDSCAGWVVTGLCDGIAPEGLRPGDTIVACDGLPLAGGADLDSLLRRPGGHRIETVRGSGRTHYDVETKERL